LTAIFWTLLYALIILLAGCALTVAVMARQRRSIAEIAGLVLLLGVGSAGTLMIVASLLGIAPGRALLIIIAIVAIVVLVMSLRRGRLPQISLPLLQSPVWFNPVSLVPILALAAGNIAVLIVAMGFPLFEWDSFVIWGLKTKVLSYSALTPRPGYFSDLRFNYSHLDYPLLLPMLITGTYGMMHEVNEQLGKVVLPLLYAAQTLLVYSGARLWLGRLGSLLLTVLLICAPTSLQIAGLGNADMALTTFHLGSTLYLVRWIGQRQRCDIILAGVFSVFAALTKNEGMPLAGIAALVAMVFSVFIWQRQTWVDLGIFMLILILGVGLWLMCRAGVPHSDENYPARLTWSVLSQNAGRLPTILRTFLDYLDDPRGWGGLWLLLPLLAMLGFRAFARVDTGALWMLLIMQLGLYVMVYIITPWNVDKLLNVSVARLLMHAAPTAALILAAHWSACRLVPAGD